MFSLVFIPIRRTLNIIDLRLLTVYHVEGLNIEGIINETASTGLLRKRLQCE